MRTFRARWGTSLIVISALSTAVCVGAGGAAGAAAISAGQGGVGVAVCLLAVLFLLGCALFTVRGYTIAPGVLFVHRLLWATRISLWGLRSASFEPQSMRWSLRTFGNGGLFSFSGKYWNRRLGSYRAFVTDLRDTVVLRFVARTIVISPDSPEQFVYDLHHLQR